MSTKESNTILIICKDAVQTEQIESYLLTGGEAKLLNSWKRFLYSQKYYRRMVEPGIDGKYSKPQRETLALKNIWQQYEIEDTLAKYASGEAAFADRFETDQNRYNNGKRGVSTSSSSSSSSSVVPQGSSSKRLKTGREGKQEKEDGKEVLEESRQDLDFVSELELDANWVEVEPGEGGLARDEVGEGEDNNNTEETIGNEVVEEEEEEFDLTKKKKTAPAVTRAAVAQPGNTDGKKEKKIPSAFGQLFPGYSCPILVTDLQSIRIETLVAIAPTFVLILEPNVRLVRQLEMYKSLYRRGMRLRVYFMFFANSIEKQCYLTAISRENKAFEQLINDRKNMVIEQDEHGNVPISFLQPLCSDVALADVFSSRGNGSSSSNSSSTRKGGEVVKTAEKSVIVDVREFMSSLPSFLHQHNVNITPVTLTVGDYVLTPDVCVERKSLPDLIGSFASGRLYSQMQSMCRHYVSPFLLIEFDPSKPFSLVDKTEIGSSISSQSVLSRIVLLVLHFPRMHLLWSRNPHHTVRYFLGLKQGQLEPDLARAAVLGTEEMGGDGSGTSGSGNADISPDVTVSFDILKKLPGVSTNHVRALITAFPSLLHLCRASADALQNILGPVNAKKLYEFLHTNNASLFVAKTSVPQTT